MSHSHSILVNLVISSLIILGGIGFTVIVDIKERKTLKPYTTFKTYALFYSNRQHYCYPFYFYIRVP